MKFGKAEKQYGLVSYTTLNKNLEMNVESADRNVCICMYVQGAAERTPRFGRVIASGGERDQWCREVIKQRCRFQCTPWRGWENIEPLLLRL